MSAPRGPRVMRRSMRIRALILTLLTAGWMLPGGALACPEDSPDADRDSHVSHDSHEHSHGVSDRGRSDHDHAAGPESRRGEAGAPLDAPTCCSDDTRAPAVLASVLDAKPRPKSIPLALPNASPGNSPVSAGGHQPRGYLAFLASSSWSLASAW